ISTGFAADFNGEAYKTVSGQNSNNSVRVTDDFMRAVETDGVWRTTFRTTGEVCETLKARDLWRMVAESAWACADPGVQYDTTINAWHTCPNTDRITASNPCSEYMFLDNTACNLASLNLTKFLREDGTFDVDGYRHAVRVFITAMEILVDFSSYPTEQITKNSHDYRPLGLGYANLGTLLMISGIPYDSDRGRAICSSLTSILCGHAYRVSAEIAASKGAFPGYAKNQKPFLGVMKRHREAAYAIDRDACPTELVTAACQDWDEAVALGERHGFRNAQSTVLAPTGTIGLLMDCDTTGIEPDFALVKVKKLSGGGYFKIINASVRPALERLGYRADQIADILAHVTGSNTFIGAPYVSRKALLDKGLTENEIERAEEALPGVFDLRQAFLPWVLGDAVFERLGIPKETATKSTFSLLGHLGFSNAEIDDASDHVIGHMTIEGAPHLRDEHYAVFDCANRNGKRGKRFLAPMSHVKMMAAAQPFLSGAISKTVNLPNDATVEDVADIYYQGWRLGLKSIALYRDGCKASQPLASAGADGRNDEKPKELAAAAPVVLTSASQVARLVDTGAPTKLARRRLPKKRRGFTQEGRVGGHKVFLRTGEYDDSRLGEIFIDMHKEGAAFRSLMNCFAISISMGLQHGVPLESFVDQFTFTRFEPQGPVEGHPNVKFATSIVDYIFRVLGVEYLRRYDLAHVPPADVLQALSAPTDTSAHRDAAVAAGSPQEPEQVELPLSAVSHAHAQPEPTKALRADYTSPGHALDAQLSEMMGDAPLCDTCGHITVRNGACYKCLNCGNSMGCS
ncbi:MAG: vitamin B12-dependent ribonucleotide reductase, partial [Planctomycetes bacterium]|nr:vitamin B12-dependent ribonucleotide reductase [Planctomycetota bacterium]